MSTTPHTLFDLLPALYRLKDAQLAQRFALLSPSEAATLKSLQNPTTPLTSAQQQQLDQLLSKASRGPLQSLLMLIDEQLAIIRDDLAQLYNNQFIETCADWVIPYIGDLIGYQSVHGIAEAVASPRAEVANTISFRRRKGTVLVLEQLARDVTGWGAHAVEFFQLLADTQSMIHIRPRNYYAPDLRHRRVREYMDSGFDSTAHKVDVRRIAVERGRYNIQNIGIFLWSLNAYGLAEAPAVAITTGGSTSTTCFRFNSLGLDASLFNHPISQGPDITALAQPFNVPDVLRRLELCHDIVQITKKSAPAVYYGAANSVVLFLGGVPVDPSRIQVADLSGPDGSWINQPASGSVFTAAIDPELGRIALVPGIKEKLTTSFYYGFNADMGGGEYSRESTFTASSKQVIVEVPGEAPTIDAALTAISGNGVVQITDNNTYQEPGLKIVVSDKGHVEIRAADGFRPTLQLGGSISVTGGAETAFDINGLVITWDSTSPAVPLIEAPDSGTNKPQLSHLGISHCTLFPGAVDPAVRAEAPGLQVVIQRSILGGLSVSNLASANVSDSIIDATDPTAIAYVASVDSVTHEPQPGGPLTLQGCTVVGKVYAELLSLVSDCIFWAALAPLDPWAAPLWALRKQEGCVRFSFLPTVSIIPRQFECVTQGLDQPDPLFYSLRYGDPSYAKLSPLTDDAIRGGADDGGEMGGFHFLLSPLRETDLRVRVQEYLPVGLEFGIFYET
jgi:hypothetical protein